MHLGSSYPKQSHADWFEEKCRTGKLPKWQLKKIEWCEEYLSRMGLNPYSDFHD